jgi:hypothetical protein
VVERYYGTYVYTMSFHIILYIYRERVVENIGRKECPDFEGAWTIDRYMGMFKVATYDAHVI